MSTLSPRLLERYYGDRVHPYRVYEAKVGSLMSADDTVLDAGCGRSAPTLRRYLGRAKRLIGVDVVVKDPDDPEKETVWFAKIKSAGDGGILITEPQKDGVTMPLPGMPYEMPVETPRRAPTETVNAVD